MEPIDWQWDDGEGVSGVHTREGQLVWWHRPVGPNGHLGEVAGTQPFDDFLARGPAGPAPPDVAAALEARLRAVDGERAAWSAPHRLGERGE